MNTAVKAGVILAVVVSLISAVSYLAGLHESPMMRPGDKTPLKAGMVINIEPSVKDGEGNAQRTDITLPPWIEVVLLKTMPAIFLQGFTNSCPHSVAIGHTQSWRLFRHTQPLSE